MHACMHIYCALETLQPIVEGGRFCFNSMPPRLRGRGLNAGEKPCFGQGKAKQAQSCPSQPRAVPTAGEGCGTAGTGASPPAPGRWGERLLEEQTKRYLWHNK